MADESDVETPAAPPRGAKKPPRGARARIEVEGDVDQHTVDDVLGAAGRRNGNGNTRTAAPHNEGVKFERAIRDTGNRIFAKRIFPSKMDDGTPLGDELELFPTGGMTKDQLKNDIREQRGGQRWHVRVLNEDDKIVAADTLQVPGNPMLDPMMEGVGDLGARGGSRRGGSGMTEPFGAPGFEAETAEEALANDPDIVKARKRVEIAKIQAEEEEQIANLAEARARRATAEKALKGEEPDRNGKAHDQDDDAKLSKALEAAVGPLREENKRLREKDEERESRSERKQELEMMVGPLKAAQDGQARALENILAKLNAPPPPPPPAFDQEKFFSKLESMESKLRGEMKDAITAAITGLRDKYDGQFSALSDKLTQVLSQPRSDKATDALVALATKPSGGRGADDPFALVAKATEAMRSLAETKTMMTGGGGTTPPDFPSYLVEKTSDMVPEVLGFLERRYAAGGGLPSREELDNMMKQHGLKMYEGLSKELKDGINKVYERVNVRMNGYQTQPGGAPAVPAPPGMQPGPAPAAAVVHTPAPAPAPVPFPGAQAPAAPPPAPAPSVVGAVPLADQYKARTNWVLKGVLHEMQLGIAGMKWPEKAYNELPRDIIERVALSENSEQVMDAIRPYADQALLDQLGTMLAEAHPRHQFNRKWLTAGINWIKDAYEGESEEPVAEDAPGE